MKNTLTTAILAVSAFSAPARAQLDVCANDGEPDELGPHCIPQDSGPATCDETADDRSDNGTYDGKCLPRTRVPYATLANGTTLEGWLYRPTILCPTKKPVVVLNHGSGCEVRPQVSEDIADYYTRRCHIVFAPHREGHGLNVGKRGQRSIKERSGDVMTLVATDSQKDWLKRRLHEYYNWQVQQAVYYARDLGDSDASRIYLLGNSFGGIQTLLAAEAVPSCVRAAIALAPGVSAGGNEPLKDRLVIAVQNTPRPIFLAQACGDSTHLAWNLLGPEVEEKPNPSQAHLYGLCSTSEQAAHSGFGTDGQDIGWWTGDAWTFLQAAPALSGTCQRPPYAPPSPPTFNSQPIPWTHYGDCECSISSPIPWSLPLECNVSSG
jgi:carboxymethylenebutenolidase